MNKIYFDNAATTPLGSEVQAVMIEVMQNDFGNPSSIHSQGRKARTLIEEARKTVANCLNCSPGEIFFTSGGTEADNMAIRKSVEDLGVKNVITTRIEHHAVLHTSEELEAKNKIKVHYVDLLSDGHINYVHLEELLQSNSNSLISLMHANNEIGNLLDIDKVAELAAKYGALFHCDTVQTVGHLPLDMANRKFDFIAAGAHKFNGPKGVGFIYIRNSAKIKPMLTGGTQERNMRGGTENIYGIVGLAKALESCVKNLENDKKHISEIKEYAKTRLQETIEGISFNGDCIGNSLYTILNVCFPSDIDADMLIFKLDIAGISVSGGSACSSGTSVGSHVLKALYGEVMRPSVRFSFGKQNTKEEIDYLISILPDLLKRR